MADEGKLEKMEVDYSSTVDERIPECEKMAKGGKLTDAIDILLSLEKLTRTGADTHSTGKLLVAIISICFENKKWDHLNENLVLLTKRRGQIKQAVTKMVQEACTYVDKTPSMEVKLKFIDTLRIITAGKIYVENERARLTKILAKIREDQGDIKEAATLLTDLQVETYGSMEKKEKVEFILEQMRLCLARHDYIRTQIISKKVSHKFFEEKDTHELKLKFFQLMIQLGQHESKYLDICKHFRAIYDTPVIKENAGKKTEVLKCAILYLLLSPYDNEQSDLIHRIQEDKQLEDLPVYKNLLKLFTTNEIMRWKDLVTTYEAELRTRHPGVAVFDPKTEEGNKRWADLKIRVVEHNIRVMAEYYTRIYLKRMSELLDLNEAETEEFLSNLVVKKTVQAKIDRLAGIVHFQKRKDPNDLLNEWSFNINSLMQHVNKATHLIIKEEMIHKLH